MDARELFTDQLDDSEYQLRQAFADLPPDSWDTKIVPSSMSAKEVVNHLTEAYVAGQRHLRGEEHEWGSYVAAKNNPEELVKEMFGERDKLKSLALATADPKTIKSALAYTANHDYYHVGQLCALRLHLDPNWDAYSIYKG